MLNKRRIRTDFSDAADTYDAAAVVQQEICQRALERLQMIKLQPQTILDIGSGTGKSVRGLQARFPKSQVIASDIAMPMLRHTQQSQIAQTVQTVCCDAEQLSIADKSIDLIFSTSTFQWCEDLYQVFTECSRVLKDDGVLIFTTFGPDTLIELRQSWAQVDEQNHVHGFIDMHHIGDLLLANYYADPVVDMELITLEYSTARQLLRDLKETGSRGKFATNHAVDDVAVGSSFATGLMGKNKFQQFELAYEGFRQDNGLLPASYEVIYGYARKALQNKNTLVNNETNNKVNDEIRISVDQIKKPT